MKLSRPNTRAPHAPRLAGLRWLRPLPRVKAEDGAAGDSPNHSVDLQVSMSILRRSVLLDARFYDLTPAVTG